ncbi:MAG TPA: alginate lyase family protein [bacterium]|nr:alginate lyase family protein [bacterium]HNS49035.1 alginate lyase family protein [bacterium]
MLKIELDNLIDWRQIPDLPPGANRPQRLATLFGHLASRKKPAYLFEAADRKRLIEELLPASGHPVEFELTKARILMRPHLQEHPHRRYFQTNGEIDWELELPYELRRHIYLQPLASHYLLTGEAAALEKGAALVRAWWQNAPVNRQERQAGALKPSLERSRSLEAFLRFFAASRDWPGWQRELSWFLPMMYALAEVTRRSERLVFHNIFYTSLRMRHAFALYFPEFKASKAWEAETLVDMVASLKEAVRTDGGQIEQSPGYHAGVMDGTADLVILRRRNRRPVPAAITDRLRRMAEFIEGLADPDGGLPCLSDTGYGRQAARPLLFKAAAALGSTRRFAGSSRYAHLFSLPPELVLKTAVRPERCRPTFAFFPESGYYAMRSGPEPEALYLVFDAGPHGYFHGHLDLFNIELRAGGQQLVPDPGTYHYSISPARLGQISTPVHNTINLNIFSHRPYEDGEPPLARILQARHYPDNSVAITALHRAFDHLWGEPVVTRQIFYDGRNRWVFVDRLECRKPNPIKRQHAFYVAFNLPDSRRYRFQPEAGEVRTTFEDRPNLRLRVYAPEKLSHLILHPGSYLSPDGQRDTWRWSAVINADQACLVHLLEVEPGTGKNESRFEVEEDGEKISVRFGPGSSPRRVIFTPKHVRVEKRSG